MMTIDVSQLQEHFCAMMCADVRLVNRGNGRLVIATPFFFPDGDPYLVYVEERPGGVLRLTDAGHTLMHLSYENDIDKFREGTRGRLFEQILSEQNVTEEAGAFFIDAPPHGLATAFFRLAQTLTQISDLTFLNRARIESTFYEDLFELLGRTVPPERITRDYIYSGIENAEDYPIDFRVEGREDPLFVFGIPNRDKARLATIVLERLLRARADFESVLIFADQSLLPRKDLARLSNAGGEMIASLDAQDDFRRKITRRAAA
jgi:hypothetical protein